jgi:hypothetical protein
MTEKFAVQWPLDGNYLYVTTGDSKFQLRVKLFDTEAEAEAEREIWGEDARVVPYKEESEVL